MIIEANLRQAQIQSQIQRAAELARLRKIEEQRRRKEEIQYKADLEEFNTKKRRIMLRPGRKGQIGGKVLKVIHYPVEGRFAETPTTILKGDQSGVIIRKAITPSKSSSPRRALRFRKVLNGKTGQFEMVKTLSNTANVFKKLKKKKKVSTKATTAALLGLGSGKRLSKAKANSANYTLANNTGAGFIRGSTDSGNFESKWKSKKNLVTGVKVFKATKGFPEIVSSLMSRGWTQNKSKDSLNFRILLDNNRQNINYKYLTTSQVVNQFQKGDCLTTKEGFADLAMEASKIPDASFSSFYPPSFDLSHKKGRTMFWSVYKLFEAESILRRISGMNEDFVNVLALDISYEICLRRSGYSEAFHRRESGVTITNIEWQILKNWQRDEEHLHMIVRSKNWQERESRKLAPTLIKRFDKITQFKLSYAECETAKKLPGERRLDDKDPEFNRIAYIRLRKFEAKKVLDKLASVGKENLWVIKPIRNESGPRVGLIKTMKEVEGLAKGKSSETNFLVQQFIPRPLLYSSKRLDLRQWVLASNYNNFEIWMYNECYARMSQKSSEGLAADATSAEEQHLSEKQIKIWLNKSYGKGTFTRMVKKPMKDIVLKVLNFAKSRLTNGKRSAEVFCFDFFVDEGLQLWLIDVNHCPDFSKKSVSKRLFSVSLLRLFASIFRLKLVYFQTKRFIFFLFFS